MIIKIKIPAEVRFDCPTCGKSFSSGKALGGHKRVHMEKKRNHETMELQIVEYGEKTLASCPVCHKPFASKKSLHGHMRKHPDRGWRGMKPPPPEGKSSQPLDHEAVSVANDLLALASGQPSLLQDRGKSVMGENSLLVDNDRGDFHHKTPVIKSPKKFSCDICGKSFRSYQALGGHKSHHSEKFALQLHMEQPERFDGISGHARGEAGINGDRPARFVFDFDLNELPKW